MFIASKDIFIITIILDEWLTQNQANTNREMVEKLVERIVDALGEDVGTIDQPSGADEEKGG